MKITIPASSQALVDEKSRPTKEWYDKFKLIEQLQPLSDIPAAPAVVDSIDTATGDFTLGYGLDRSSQELLAGLTSLSGALGSDVALNNTSNYFDGPSITLGTGTWFVTGTVAVGDGAAVAAIYCKLWDGTTVISSTVTVSNNTVRATSATLSGIITNPVGNVKISCRDVDSTSGGILFNRSGNSKDSHITAVRIA